MIIDINNTKNDLVANIDKMETPSKNKKVSGKPYTVITLNDVGGNNFIIMKSYYSQASNSIELTLKHGGLYHRVVGKATGYGYHRLSAALADALEMLNVTIVDDLGQKEYIDGRGDGVMRDALLAIAKALNWQSIIMNEIYL